MYADDVCVAARMGWMPSIARKFPCALPGGLAAA